MGHRQNDGPQVDGRRGGKNAAYMTAEWANALQAGEKRLTFLDTLQHGLQLIVYPTGKKIFFHRRKSSYASRRLKIGAFPGMSIAEARKRADVLNGRYSRGEDPGQERHEQRQELTVGGLFTLFMNEHMKPHRRTVSVQSLEQLWKTYLAPALANRKLSAITRGDVATLHSRIGRTYKITANRAIQMLSSMFSFAINRDEAPAGWQGLNPCRGVTKFKETPRKRFLHHDELPRFLAALEAESNSNIKDLYLMLLLTGARKSNVLAMKWADLDLASSTWSVGAEEAKGGEAMELALTDQAVDLLHRRKGEAHDLIERVRARSFAPVPRMGLQAAKRWQNEANKAKHAAEFVFPGVGRTGHLIDAKKVWRALLERAQIQDLHLHDLRRTVGAWMAASGANLFQLKAALGHRSTAAAAVYAQLEIGGVRAGLEKVQATWRGVVAQAREDAAKVTPIRPAGNIGAMKAKGAARRKAAPGGAR